MLEEFKANPGTLGGREWQQLKGAAPQNDMAPCWWVVLSGELDEAPQLLCHSLKRLELELQHHRMATPAKLSSEWLRRCEANEEAISVLRDFHDIWQGAGGPRLEDLRKPSVQRCQDASRASARLREELAAGVATEHPALADLSGDDRRRVVQRLSDAGEAFEAMQWSAIWSQKFTNTPREWYEDMTRAAESRFDRQLLLQEQRARRGDSSKPAQVWSAVHDSESEDEAWSNLDSSPSTQSKDPHVDPDEFKRYKAPIKPQGWDQVVARGLRVHVEEMRFRLEGHYDKVHAQRWRRPTRPDEGSAAPPAKKPKRHANKNIVFTKAANNQLENKFEVLDLPPAVKDLLRQPGDENDWGKLEELRRIVRDECEGRQHVPLSEDGLASKVEAAILEDPLTGSHARLGVDVVDLRNPSAVLLPKGARLELRPPHCKAGAQHEHYAKAAVAAIQAERGLWVRLRPLGTELAMPLRKEDLAMFRDKKTLKTRAEKSQDTTADVLDRLLEVLWAALFFSRSMHWSGIGVANVSANRTLLLGENFAKGQNLSAKPLHDGICAYCGELLYGTVGNSVSNKAFGPPVDVDGRLLANKPGAKARDQQPPFLLRFSPALLAYEIPAVFKHEPESNKLSLQDGVSPPWLRRTTGRNSRWAKADATNTWLYCRCCAKTRVGKETPSKGFVAFRDQNSQCLLKPPGIRRPREIVEEDEAAMDVEQDASFTAGSDDQGDRLSCALHWHGAQRSARL